MTAAPEEIDTLLEEVLNRPASVVRPRTDTGNAERLVDLHGRDLRYSETMGWLVWDDTRWRSDDTAEVERRAKDTVRAIPAEALLIVDEKEQKQLLNWAKRSEAEARRKALLKLAASEPAIAMRPSDFDTSPWLLAVANGTIDLRTGQLREHRRDDLITKMSSVHYDAAASCERWRQFLHDATGGDEELEAFLRRAVGYSLTADTSEEVLFFLHGPTASGKSTFIDAVRSVLGDHARVVDFGKTLTVQRGATGPREDLARLAGARMMISVELSSEYKLDAGLVKLFTGGDLVVARHLYRASFEYQPTFKIWLVSNDAPSASHADDALWRRILRVPFNHTVPSENRQPDLKRYLRDPGGGAPAVLAWAVQGAREWHEGRLDAPAVVTQATSTLREEMDPTEPWMQDCLVMQADAWTPSTELQASYKSWCRDAGITPASEHAWGEGLRRRGAERSRRRMGGDPVSGWSGVRLR